MASAEWMKKTGTKIPATKGEAYWTIIGEYKMYLCKLIICSFDCSMYQINAATHTRVSSLICNQKLMKITLQPHFSAI